MCDSRVQAAPALCQEAGSILIQLLVVKMTGQSWGLLYTNPVFRLSSLANLVVSLTDTRAGHARDDPFEDERGETSSVS